MVRVGRSEKISEALRHATLDAQIEREAALQATERKKRAQKELEAAVQREVAALRAELEALTPIALQEAEAKGACAFEFAGCSVEKLNGVYRALPVAQPKAGAGAKLNERRVYSMRISVGEAGEAAQSVFCFWKVSKKLRGWWLNYKRRITKALAYCPSDACTPPSTDWRVVSDGDEGLLQADGGGFHAHDDSATLVERACMRKEASLRQAAAATPSPPPKGEQFRLKSRVLKSAEVICAQAITAGGDMLKSLGNFAGVLVDEVGQSTELGAIVPVVRRGARRLVLSGDHCQLPPSVVSREAQARGLDISLFARPRLGLDFVR